LSIVKLFVRSGNERHEIGSSWQQSGTRHRVTVYDLNPRNTLYKPAGSEPQIMIADFNHSAVAWQLVKVAWLVAAWTSVVHTGRRTAVKSTAIIPHPELT
jgi:hypothetical protein